jgi:Isochorismatase family
MIQLDPARTALVLIDLQNGIVGMPLAPRSGPDVLAVGKTLAERFRAAKAKVVLVRVDFAEDFADAPSTPVDQPMTRPPGGMPKERPGWPSQAIFILSSAIGAPSTAPSSICNYAGEGLRPSCSAESQPISASNRPRDMPGSTATPS